ncbi:flagellar hook capping FlgD N-terminal domain-containing protein [uncultured Roseobacter sp.]|uniref:flagellar hook capping FlgD N-terminal domain-containing protein n=1 Tax=uncultured Roseobacter sp. TaxID=114847 RepID=UPI002633FCFA|nr:flagellar hook capping FlgD N-terminal domain-containing protein [uncultured Roseobacter sp.]
MEVTNSPATQSAAAAASSAPAAAILSSDFETFLQMLTAQARYQDPLEPIDSSEYAAQLAQFSMVEQQVLSNDLLEALGNQLGASNIAQMAGWIGMEARTTAPIAFDGAPVTIIARSETGADEAYLIAYNANGEEVQRRQITTGTAPVEWTGTKDDGSVFDSGMYSFAVESRAVGKTIGTTAAETYTRITEARRQGTETVFVLQGGSTVTSNDIAALRDPV